MLCLEDLSFFVAARIPLIAADRTTYKLYGFFIQDHLKRKVISPLCIERSSQQAFLQHGAEGGWHRFWQVGTGHARL
jgi:hypothetical protein